ncbi:unnamed protein product [Parajaminaea phylloscopi]
MSYPVTAPTTAPATAKEQRAKASRMYREDLALEIFLEAVGLVEEYCRTKPLPGHACPREGKNKLPPGFDEHVHQALSAFVDGLVVILEQSYVPPSAESTTKTTSTVR